ncbi:FtsW/RodA/SpoVE family cell cycle protein [Priestia aryabhattai]|uniref:Cell division protein FtsW n=1 Tax=Priestia megaterium Q3 TaxID=1452722 RepID=A0A806TIJ4_PRIMG|nr:MULTISPECIES: FtsW/RodA/SpoVE family cell cycle protein [Priestia]AKP77982.1 Cell division protein FtsW [Priestia megaterium Q3]MBY0077427.1 FtsW/RodA/SpoVE family cell cycle protein [Priestia aryabhattai]MEB4859178.1 FtsW/RodA/SpoVE family cell cycle protein [Priestia megaterium]MED3884610.1 FtsW/RodA/SpoVE family cell cycle protein [Priestia aryabhattai]MED3921369.1 FtsW/RodA/SpoVE family cell cycle protein [Priestia aryabhattai]
MKKEEFLQSITQEIKHKEAKEAVYQELDTHIKNLERESIQRGVSQEEAEKKAVEQMGSSAELSRRFQKLYRTKIDWILVSLFVAALGLGMLTIKLGSSISMETKLITALIGLALTAVCAFQNYRKWREWGWVAFIAPTLLLVVFNLHILPERIQPNVQGTTVVNLSFFSLDLNFILIFYLIGWGYILQRRSCNVPIMAVLFILTIVLYGRLTSIPNVMMYIIMIASMFIFSARKHAKKITLLFLLTLFIIIAVMLLLSGSSYYLSRLSIVLHLGKDPAGAGYVPVHLSRLFHQAEWLPQANPSEGYRIGGIDTEFVYAGLTYAYGWGISIFIMLVLSALLVKMILLIKQIRDPFGKMLVSGSVSVYAFQLLYNLGMSFNLLPIMGVWLPFISYGMGPTIANAVFIGIVLSIYKTKDIPIKELAN